MRREIVQTSGACRCTISHMDGTKRQAVLACTCVVSHREVCVHNVTEPCCPPVTLTLGSVPTSGGQGITPHEWAPITGLFGMVTIQTHSLSAICLSVVC